MANVTGYYPLYFKTPIGYYMIMCYDIDQTLSSALGTYVYGAPYLQGSLAIFVVSDGAAPPTLPVGTHTAASQNDIFMDDIKWNVMGSGQTERRYLTDSTYTGTYGYQEYGYTFGGNINTSISILLKVLIHSTDDKYIFANGGPNVPLNKASLVLPSAGKFGFYYSEASDWQYPNNRFYVTSDQSSQVSNFAYRLVQKAIRKIPTDPYADLTPTAPGGGDQPYNPFDTDDIDYNLLPEVSAVGTGFISLWCPTEQQMLDLSEYMWNANPLTLEYWRKLIADPIQLVYGLNIIPLNLASFNIVGATPEDVVVGMISTGIKMNYLTSQWVELDCGAIDIDESMLGSYMDYDPYTRLEVYLPYIGYRALKVDDFMPGVMEIHYKIDLLTGACVAQIKATKSDQHDDVLDSIVYQFIGNCASQIPVTATQYADAVRSAITTAAAIGTLAMIAGSGGAAAGIAAGTEIMPAAEPAGLLNAPGMVPVDSELYGSMLNFDSMAPEISNTMSSSVGTLKNVGAIHAGASAASNVLGMKPHVQRSGAIGGAAGMLSTQKPYVIFTRPRIAHPEDQNKYTGFPSFVTATLGDLEGFTQIHSIHLEGLPCTANELAEIDALLKSGVIF